MTHDPIMELDAGFTATRYRFNPGTRHDDDSFAAS